MVILAVSPHLDDAAFSAGGALAMWSQAGHEVIVATVFTRSVPNPAGFALACQTDKGLAPEADYMAIRRAEDKAACAALGAEAIWLDLPEAPHRGYHSPEALFAGVHVGDRQTWREVHGLVRALVAARRPDLILSCQGLGGHADHAVVIRAVSALTPEASGGSASGVPVAWWRDAPYAMRELLAPADPGLPDGLQNVSVPLAPQALSAKLDACAAYATQLPYQFGRDADVPAEQALRQRLTAFAEAEGDASGATGPTERWLAPAWLAWPPAGGTACASGG